MKRKAEKRRETGGNKRREEKRREKNINSEKRIGTKRKGQER